MNLDNIKPGFKIKDKLVVEILTTFPLYYQAWELDCIGWIVKFADNTKGIIMTDHGDPYIALGSDLEIKIKEYLNAIHRTQCALDILRS